MCTQPAAGQLDQSQACCWLHTHATHLPISMCLDIVKHRLYVCSPPPGPAISIPRPYFTSRALSCLLSSHVVACLGKLFASSHAYLLLGTWCPKPFLCEFAQIESFPSSKTWRYGKKISGIIDRIRNSMLVTQV